MTREQLEHVLRAASRIAGQAEVLVIGSQSILGSHEERALPPEATTSMEADIAFFHDPGDSKADLVDGAIGELSDFHETIGYYAQGVSVTTAILPEGWRDRIVVLDTPGTQPGRGLCLEVHDCVIAKLAAGREKDFAFADALVRGHLVSLDVLADRAAFLDAHPLVIREIQAWVSAHRQKMA
jgi:hypothetical protein